METLQGEEIPAWTQMVHLAKLQKLLLVAYEARYCANQLPLGDEQKEMIGHSSL